MLLKKYFSGTVSTGALNQLDEFTNFIDLVYYVWLLVPNILIQLKNPDEQLKSKILDVLKEIPIPSEEELQDYDPDVLLCSTKSTFSLNISLNFSSPNSSTYLVCITDKTKFKPKYVAVQESIQNLWSIVLKWNTSFNSHKKVLVLLIENILPHLSKPILTMDYLMESLNAGIFKANLQKSTIRVPTYSLVFIFRWCCITARSTGHIRFSERPQSVSKNI